MYNKHLFTDIREILDYMDNMNGVDPYYKEKKAAKIRELKYYARQFECIELADCIKRKINKFYKS